MIRIIWFVLLIAAVVLASLWVVQNPGTIEINWFGREVSLSVGIGLLILLLFSASIIFIYVVLRGIWKSPGNLMKTYRNSKRSRGYKALTLGMVAVAAGDPDEARKQSKKADVLLSEPPLTMLLQAQSAQLNGDEDAARKYFILMLDNKETAFLGLRGLVNQAIRNDDQEEALKLAYKAKKLRPDSKWVFDQIYQLEAGENHFGEALSALEEAQSRKLLPKEESKHKQAVVLTQLAYNNEDKGLLDVALENARKAVSRDPELSAAQAIYARLLVRLGKNRKAIGSIEKAWKSKPYPEIVAIYLDAKGVTEPMERYKTGARLFDLNPEHSISLIARAETALAADLWGEARKCLEAANNNQESEKAYKMLAEVERAEGGKPEVIYAYMEKAAGVPQESVWICNLCSEAHGEWQMRCQSCGEVDSLKWRSEALVQNRIKQQSGDHEVIDLRTQKPGTE